MLQFPKRRRIYLMRHAEAAYVSADGEVTKDPEAVPLTTLGRQQAGVQGDLLASIQFDRAICSGLPRTLETAGIVLEKNHHSAPELEQQLALKEIQGLGGARVWPEEPDAVRQILERMANPWADGDKPGAQFLDGEAFADFGQRVSTAWQGIVSDPDWDTLLLVLHGAVNRMIFNLVHGISWSGQVCVEQDNACINIIDVDDIDPPRYLVRGVNITGYNLNKLGIDRTNMESTALRVAELLQGR